MTECLTPHPKASRRPLVMDIIILNHGQVRKTTPEPASHFMHFLITLTVMSFLGKGKKADLIKLAIELGECESNGEELKIIELRTEILTNDAYKEDPEFVKWSFEGIVSNRTAK
ncbi:hypothetical protein TNCV_940111 [Trichonephila clavipes]|nr:hypothetical protein TNCV_940111 [Trichonephila clavipes]